MTSLIKALDLNDIDEIMRILEEEPSFIDEKDTESRSVLHYAAEFADFEIFKKIYEMDTTLLDATDKDGNTPLMNALMVGRTDIASFLATSGANVNHVDNDGHNVIHWTTVCGQIEALNWAIERKVDINAKDVTQEGAAIHYATVAEDIAPEVGQAVLITLLRHGANPNARDRDDRTPVLWCASNGNVQALVALQNSGAELTAKDRDMLGALHCAASHGYHEVIDIVLSRVPRSHVDDQDRAGHTPLFYAVTFGHYESALRLLNFGADPNHQDHRLRTPCHCAAAKGQMRMLKLLKSFNASFDIQNYRGDMPFHEAVQSGSKDVVEWLLAMDSSVLDAPNHHGRTALHLAAAAGNLEVVILLCTKKSFVDPLMNIKDQFFTPLDIAKEQKHEVIVEYLTKICSAKSSKDFSEEYIQEWKRSFEEMVAKAKIDRDFKVAEQKRLKMENLQQKRPSTTEGKVVAHNGIDVGVNTSQRSVKSAQGTRPKPSFSKSTSVTNLIDEEPAEKHEIQDADAESGREHDYLDVDEEFENLPPISDETDSSSSAGSSLENELQESKNEKTEILNKKSEEVKEKKGKKKEVRISTTQKKLQQKSPAKSGGKVVMRVKREPEIGNDGGEIDIYEDGDENSELSENEQEKSDSGKGSRKGASSSNRRYIHERAIFQELTHLKRMQIQYGKVQERILVRSLISNFCKMHGLDVDNFKFQTFYAWEKFLYDALSEQLKIIYLDERERLSESHTDPKTGSSVKLNKFDSRVRRSIPFNNRIRDMQNIYESSRIFGATKKATKNAKCLAKIQGSKRCDCLEKHILM